MLCELTDAGDERLKDQSVKRKYRAGWPSLEGGWPSLEGVGQVWIYHKIHKFVEKMFLVAILLNR